MAPPPAVNQQEFIHEKRAHKAFVTDAVHRIGNAGRLRHTKTIYHWGDYQQQVYQHFKTEGNSSEEQIAALEQGIVKARANGGAMPPGYHAHLGMLYARIGKHDQVVQSFETEKTLFPESSGYIDFLLNKYRK